MKIQIKMGGGVGEVGLVGGGQGGWEWRIEAFVKIKKKVKNCFVGGSGRGGVRVDVNREVKFL